MADTTRQAFKKLTKAVFSTLTIFKTEEGWEDGVKDGLNEIDLTEEAATSEIVDNLADAFTLIGNAVNDWDPTKADAVDTAVTDLRPILTSLVDWTKQYVGSHPGGIGEDDDD